MTALICQVNNSTMKLSGLNIFRQTRKISQLSWSLNLKLSNSAVTKTASFPSPPPPPPHPLASRLLLLIFEGKGKSRPPQFCNAMRQNLPLIYTVRQKTTQELTSLKCSLKLAHQTGSLSCRIALQGRFVSRAHIFALANERAVSVQSHQVTKTFPPR